MFLRNRTTAVKSFKKPCSHKGPTYCCSEINLGDVQEIRNSFNATNDKIQQDIKLCHFLSATAAERKRSIKNQPRKREFAVAYFIPKRLSKKKIQVCQAMFLRVLNICKDRVRRVAKVCFEGKIPKELRGGDRISKKHTHTKQNIRQFLDGLPAKESHYNRRKSKRVYLDCSLTMRKLFNLYIEQCAPELKTTKFDMFRNIFINEYNIGFSSPASDCCAQCMRLKYLKNKERDEDANKKIALELTMHKKSANAFYESMRSLSENSYTFCFDLQQVQPLPRTPINDSFYSHQVSLYNFCCVDIKAKSPTFYIWTEDQAGRGAEEIGSALFHHLNSLTLTDIHTLRLFCDGCGGQNRNSYIIHTLYYWLKFKAPTAVTEIIITYPVRGHSFLPADRVFGRVEKDLRKHPVLILKSDYETIYKSHGVVRSLDSGEENSWKIYNIKALEEKLKKMNGISDMKVISLKKATTGNVSVCGFQHFRFRTGTEKYTTLSKPQSRGILQSDWKVRVLESQRGIPEKKKKSLGNLLTKQFGNDWKNDKNLAWYNDLLHRQPINNMEDETAEPCDCLSEENAVHI